MKITNAGDIPIKCPNCGRKETLHSYLEGAICDCGAEYIGRGKWITPDNEEKINKV